MKEKLTIGLPCSSFLPALGGAEVGLHNIALRLGALGHTPIVMVPWSHAKALRKKKWELPYPVISMPPLLGSLLKQVPEIGFQAYRQFYGYVGLRYGIDVWHGTMGYPTGVTLANYAASKKGVPNIVRCAGEDIQRMDQIDYGMRSSQEIDDLIVTWLPKAGRLVAITESVVGEYQKMGVPHEHIIQIPNGVDVKRFRSAKDNRIFFREKLGLTEEDFVFLSVGRHHPKKNFITAIQAFAELKKITTRSVHLILVGKNVSQLQDEVVLLGLKGAVSLIEEVGGEQEQGKIPIFPGDDLLNIYGVADAFVFPSLIETFGIAIVEAMAAGLPVITTDSPGCRDIAKHGECALIVDPMDKSGMAREMKHIIDDQSYREEYAAKALERAANFDWNYVVDQYLALYYQVITEKGCQLV